MGKRTNLKTWLVMATFLLGMVCTAAGRIITVDDDGPADFNSIQAAIEDSNDGDTVFVLPGRYYENIDFQGSAITVKSSDPNDPNVVQATVIDANNDAPDDIVVSFHSSEGPNSVITGFTITGGQADSGGGIYCCDSSSPTISNCTITGNSADIGGGIYCGNNSNPTIIDCNITGNSAELTDGGGIGCDSSSPTISNCTFSGNSAQLAGGGIYRHHCSGATISNCTFSGNSAQFEGGGIHCHASDTTISNCTFSGNSATAATGDGGGIYCHASDTTISNCTFSGNSATGDGGGIYCVTNDNDTTISNCTFSSNSATGAGGGIYCVTNAATISNCTITGNSANYSGGGIYCVTNAATISNCTFSGNSAQLAGGGIYCHASDTTISNCTLSGNFADFGGGIYSQGSAMPVITNNIIVGSPSGCGIYASDSTPLISYNNLWGNTDEDYCGWASAGEGDISSDPCFIEPGYWDDPCGTPADPCDDVWIDGDYHLVAGSPCIDAGDNSTVPPDIADLDDDGNTTEPTPIDLDGLPRFVDDLCTADSGNGTPPIVDMGAYEFLSSDINSDGSVDFEDFAIFAPYWRDTGCGLCGGADLTCDGNVDWNDLRELVAYWLAGP